VRNDTLGVDTREVNTEISGEWHQVMDGSVVIRGVSFTVRPPTLNRAC
jgi:hypothetical protein